MLEAVNTLIQHNPEFIYHLYDDADCLDFITQHFDKSVVNAYTTLIPGAYKADLWRYCVLYINGGVYLDIKFYPINGFKFLEIINSEHFVKDREHILKERGIYNGFIISKPNNVILWNCIRKIVDNVNTQFYGKNPFEPTGPLLVSKFITDSVYNNLRLQYEEDSFNTVIILQNNSQKIGILRMYNEFREEQFISSPEKYYQSLWIERNIYNQPKNNIYYNLLENNALESINEITAYCKTQNVPVIPLNIYQTWNTKDLPPKILEATNSIKTNNSEFVYHLYDNADCLDFITQHFDKSVVDAYNALVPIAYKADLWRYCILYINGGIYLDIKFYPINGFKLLELTTQEHFAKDIEKSGEGILNGLLITKPKNPILLQAILQIVENVKNNYYGTNPLEPTGPLLLKRFFTTDDINNLPLRMHDNGIQIIFNDKPILEFDHKNYLSIKYTYYNYASNYITLWHIKQIYDGPVSNYIKHIIPFNIYQTWHTKDLSPNILKSVNAVITNNPEFVYHLYDDADCLDFITQHFDKSVVDAYTTLIPGAYKADLWRYCILYINGGIYLDIKFYPINGFKLLELTTQEHFVKYIEKYGQGIYNGLLITKPKNPILLQCILQIVENVKNNYYGTHALEVTGPLLMKPFFTQEFIHNLPLQLSDNGFQITFNDKPILEYDLNYHSFMKFNTYNKNIKNDYINYYADLWNKGQIYKTNISSPVIPFFIYQTWHTKDLSPKLLESTNSIITNNPEFSYHLYDAHDCSDFIKQNFSNTIYETYNNLIPYSYKTDLWKYCILYINGGIYLDMGFYNNTSFKLLDLTNQEFFVKDFEEHGGGIYNGFIVVKPRNQIMLNCILAIVENVKNNVFNQHPYEMTGPLLIKKHFTPEEITNIAIKLEKFDDNTIRINYKNTAILQRVQ